MNCFAVTNIIKLTQTSILVDVEKYKQFLVDYYLHLRWQAIGYFLLYKLLYYVSQIHGGRPLCTRVTESLFEQSI